MVITRLVENMTDVVHCGIINDLTEIRNNAKSVAKRDGYNQVIIEDKDGYYSFSRKYDGCCPLWYGRIIEEITI